jgi:U4/U6 small nuclear ribonucleoprotein PRP4
VLFLIFVQVKYEPSQGYFLVTSSHDNTARIWSGKDFKAVKTLAGHEGKILDVDVSSEGEYITTAAYDRTIKLWAPEPEPDDMAS